VDAVGRGEVLGGQNTEGFGRRSNGMRRAILIAKVDIEIAISN
jgi:hypothetical protein